MHPELFTFAMGSGATRAVSSYGLCLMLAVALGCALWTRRVGRVLDDHGAAIVLACAALAGAFVGADALAVLNHGIATHDWLAAVTRGGLVFYGGLFGGALALWLGARIRQLPAAMLFDAAVVPLACAHALGRVGCWLGGCCYGQASTLPWASVYPDGVARHPWPLYEGALVLLLAAWIQHGFSTRRFATAGQGAARYLMAYSVMRALLEPLRDDAVRGVYWGGLVSTSQVVAVVSALVALVYLRSVSRPVVMLASVATSLCAWLAVAQSAHVIVPPAVVRIESGGFSMGASPSHRVFVPRYVIDRFEVSNAAYRRCLLANECAPAQVYTADFGAADDNHPVVGVRFSDAQQYCAFVGGRLPTEAEWERAARGGSARRYPWGSAWNDHLANHGGEAGTTDNVDGHRFSAPVDAYADGVSAYGLFNMAGNVWELVADIYDADYYKRSPSVAPTGPEAGDSHVMRGGSWRTPPEDLRVTHRAALHDGEAKPDVGFRCAYDVAR